MARLDTKTRKKAEAPTEENTLAIVAQDMREAKVAMDKAEVEYKTARASFLNLMGNSKKFEDNGFAYSVSVPVSTRFDGEKLVTDHPEAEFLVTATEVTTVTYSLNEDAAQEAIEQDDEGIVLALIQEYVTETPGSPRVSIKAVSDE